MCGRRDRTLRSSRAWTRDFLSKNLLEHGRTARRIRSRDTLLSGPRAALSRMYHSHDCHHQPCFSLSSLTISARKLSRRRPTAYAGTNDPKMSLRWPTALRARALMSTMNAATWREPTADMVPATTAKHLAHATITWRAQGLIRRLSRRNYRCRSSDDGGRASGRSQQSYS